jgi:hypothetical protein
MHLDFLGGWRRTVVSAGVFIATIGLVTAGAYATPGGFLDVRVHILGCDWKPEDDNPDKPDDTTVDLNQIGRLSQMPLPLNLTIGMREDADELRKVYGVNARGMLMDETGSPNACAIDYVFKDALRSVRIDPSTATDGTVLIGTKLIRNEWLETNGQLWSVPTILGHEFAHIMQNKKGFPATSSKWRELHADFMSGWFTAHRGRFRPQNALQSMVQVYRKGDGAFFSPDHHGTPEERARAFTAGFNLNIGRNISSANTAYQAGIQYLNACGADLSESGTDGDIPVFFQKP